MFSAGDVPLRPEPPVHKQLNREADRHVRSVRPGCPPRRHLVRTRRERHSDHARLRVAHVSSSDPLRLRGFRGREDPPVPACPALVPGW